MVTHQFKRTALSLAGCDGGNPNSEIWFCGLEHGYDSSTTLEDFLALSDNTIYSWDHSDYIGSWTAQYNAKICWFLWYFYHLEWNDGENAETFVKRHHILYSEQAKGIGFKLNMLPLGFKKRNAVNWTEQYQQATGFASFTEYRNWCIEYRGAFFRELIRTHKPKVIVCTGISEVSNFIRFFTGNTVFTYSTNPTIKIAYAQFEDTLICVCPFFGGAWGINSYKKMEILVKDIQEKLAS